ncbi:MAG: MBL fold metallo-hydrolase [Cytophagia bacterium]|nr:MBL fold metallo-hydrolase [Cytophagia bacterium]NBW35260.1 MBL fold metallo-hydrolase [Cytophagia bacterium]
MALFAASLNSGSNGNCYYVGNANEAVLVDVGISCREVEKRMKRLGLSPKQVKAIFVSHEHGDHIHGVPALAAKFEIPVYITEATYRAANLSLAKTEVRSFVANQSITIGALQVTPFLKQHDAVDPHSFIVQQDEICVGIMTDIGRACDQVIKYLQQCHAVFIESNYDVDMLERGGYPRALKNRIRNGLGHLSNVEAAELVKQYHPDFLSHVFLSHLSRNNNSPERALTTFQSLGLPCQILVAPRDKETPLFLIDGSKPAFSQPAIVLPEGSQLKLF